MRAFWSFAMVLMFLASGAPAGERFLHIYTWADYFDSEVIDAFQKEHNCFVVLSIFDSNELLLKALGMDRGSYDILTPSSYMVDILRRREYIADVDHSLLPNLHHLTPDAAGYTADPGMRFSIPYTRTVAGIGYSKQQIAKATTTSWRVFGNSLFSGRTAMLTDMRECLGAALKMLGFSLNSTNPDEIAAAGRVVREWRRNAVLFDAEEGKAGLLDGRFALVHNYNGDIMQAMAEDPNLGFSVPTEGASLASDEFVITADTPEWELAHAFINHMLDPTMALRNMKSVFYYMPNATALAELPPEIAENPAFTVPQPTLEKCEIIREVGEANAYYEREWARVLSFGDE